MLQERPGPAQQRDRLRLLVSVDTRHDLVRAGLVGLLQPFRPRVVVDLPDRAHPGRDDRGVVAPGPAGRAVTVVDLLGLDDLRLRRLAGLQDAGVPLVGLLPSSPGDLHHRARELRLSAQVPLDVTAEDLIDALEDAVDPRPRPRAVLGIVGPGGSEALSEREDAILDLIVDGRSNDEMAASLHLSVNTVKTHVRGLYRKLGVQRRSQVVALVLRRWPERPGG